jgi:putative membrane protein
MCSPFPRARELASPQPDDHADAGRSRLVVGMAADKEIETMDALRRTRLANERTYLAWWRSALTALAVAVGTGRIAPGLAGGAEWPYRTLGAAFAVLAAALAGCAYVRQRNVERAIARSDYAPLDGRVAVGLAAVTIVLAAATIALVLAGR